VAVITKLPGVPERTNPAGRLETEVIVLESSAVSVTLVALFAPRLEAVILMGKELPGGALTSPSKIATDKSVVGSTTTGAVGIDVVSEAELLNGLLSVMLVELIVTLLVKTVPPGVEGLVTALKVNVLAPGARVKAEPVTTIFPGVPEAINPTGSPDTEVTELGRVLVIIVLVTLAPLGLVAVIVYGNVPPAATLVKPSVTDTDKSVVGGTIAVTVVVSVKLLLLRIGSLTVLTALILAKAFSTVPTGVEGGMIALNSNVVMFCPGKVKFVPVITMPLAEGA
jgi:hypothetical protein